MRIMTFVTTNKDKFRPSLLDALAETAVAFACKDVHDLAVGPASRTTPGDVKTVALQSYMTLLTAFASEAKHKSNVGEVPLSPFCPNDALPSAR